MGLVDAPELATLEPALTGVIGLDTGPVWIAEVLWGGGEDPGHRTTIIVPDAAIEEGRATLTIIVDGEVQQSVTSIN